MAIEKLRPSWTFDEERIEELKRIAPEAFADGKINWDVLREALGDYLEEDNPDVEHFGLFWPGKREARKIASTPSKGTIVPVQGEGVDEDKTKNIFIEGENLEVLKLLQKSYAGKVKMIYIDPPYNTGNDFVYEDDFKESLEEYLKRTGQMDEQGKPLTTNKKADGRFHSKWLSMMYPRLRLARNLLREDGVIFVSIDDNEVHNLRQIMNEIFGDEKFIVSLVWKSRQNKDNRNVTGVSNDHEYVLVYGLKIRGDERKIEQYSNPDNDPRGDWTSGNMVGILPEDQRPNCHYDLINPKTGINYGKPKMGWRYDKKTMSRLIEENRIIWPDSESGRPRKKTFLLELQNEFTGFSSFIGENIYTRNGTTEIENIMNFRAFDFPKSTDLIKELLSQGAEYDSIILDFFAGSGTTAHAVIDLNKEDGGNRQFILVQMPEMTDEKTEAFKAGYETIAEISKERIRRAGKKIKEEFESKHKDNTLEFEEEVKKELDFGFKVFKLTKSNYKEWTDYNGTDLKQLETLFDNALDPLVPNWKEEEVLTEIMLIEGFPLDSNIIQLEEYKANKILLVSSDFHEHKLIICLDKELKDQTIKEIKIVEPDIFICLDSSITDEFKVRLQDKGRIKTI